MKKRDCPYCQTSVSKQVKRCPNCGKYIHKHYKTLTELERNNEIIDVIDLVEDLKKKYKLSRQAISQIYHREKKYEE